MRIGIFLIFLWCFLTTPSWAQQRPAFLPANSLLLSSTQVVAPVFKKPLLYLSLISPQHKTQPDLHALMLNQRATDLPAAYCTADLAFFCRLEVQMEKATKIPVRFRLGDVQYVDYLEGKHEGWRYNR